MKGDFTGFSFDGIHSSQLNIVHVSSSDRYDEELFPEVKDKTIEIPNNHGEYYYGSTYGTRTFEIDIAYDAVTEEQFRNIRRLFGTRKICELIFDERPYKVYYAKIESPIEMSYICFDEEEYIWNTEGHKNYIPGSVDHKQYTGNKRRIYKGEGTINLICYQPFAHQLFKILDLYRESGENKGNLVTTYTNVDEWAASSGLLTQEQWNQYHIDQVITTHGKVNSSLTISAGETKTYTLSHIPLGSVQIIGIDTESYTYNEETQTYTFINETENELHISIVYEYKDDTLPYTYTIPVYNPGDLDVGFCLFIPFVDGKICPADDKTDIIINGDSDILVLKEISQKGNDAGILINTRTHLIEGVQLSRIANYNDYRKPAWEVTGNLYNEYIKMGDFPMIRRNDWRFDTVDNGMQAIYISCKNNNTNNNENYDSGIRIYYDYLYF